MTDNPWWRGATIYQIYPRSFFDSNADGIGDLTGITEKLEYVANLGVDAIWVSPFFESPMKDFGYDISDYRKIDPIFGSMDDFDALIEKAHAFELKLIIDQVLSHTSDQHAWFLESQQSKTNTKADWYVWADALDDGSPPNNWLSIFGGSAWEWNETRGQYYLHNFLKSQPDLNYHCPELRQAILQEVKFWLDKGVDGFRLDAINFCFHDKQLRNNPFKPKNERKNRGFSTENPYAAQYHIYDNNQPEILSFLQELRELFDQYPSIGSVGEINTENVLDSVYEYTSNRRLHLGYSFELLADEGSPEYIRQTVETLENKLDGGMGCWAISNHDVQRVVSRWGKKDGDPQKAKMLSIMLASLRGTICIYQGEELGLCEADICFEEIQDPFGKEFWPEFKGRDGCRTPMPWHGFSANAGFSNAAPWLKVPEAHLKKCVSSQSKDANSVLNTYSAFLKWRKQQLPLIIGDIEFLPSSEHVLAFVRAYEGSRIYCYFNFSDTEQSVSIPLRGLTEIVLSCVNGAYQDGHLVLPPYGIYFYRNS